MSQPDTKSSDPINIIKSLENVTQDIYDKLRPDSQKFIDLCRGLAALHVRKAHDYGNGLDPLGNFRSAERLGVKPSIGIFIRLQDKFARLESFCKKGTLLNESIRDNLIDTAAYCLLAVVVLEREQLEADLGGTD